MLGLGLHETQTYGLRLIQLVSDATSGRVQIRQGNVYPLLRKLQKKKLLVSFLGQKDTVRGGRRRRYYELTALGRKAANEVRGTLGAIARLIPG